MAAVAHENPIDYAFEFYNNVEFIDMRLLNHARDHSIKVNLNLSGLVGSLGIPTTTAVNSFSLAIGAKETELGIQRGKTSLKDIMLMNFIIDCRFNFPVFKNIFRANPDIYLEFAPHGLSEFDKLTTENAEVVIHRVATACHHHEMDITLPVATIFYNYDTHFPIVRGAQIDAIGAYVEDVALKVAARNLVINQLVYNTGFCIDAFRSNRPGALALFDYSKLYIHHSSPHQYINITALANKVTNVPGAVIPDGKRVLGRNLGDGPLIMSIELGPAELPGANKKTIAAHYAASAKVEDIRNGSGNCLNIYNANPFDILVQVDIYDA